MGSVVGWVLGEQCLDVEAEVVVLEERLERRGFELALYIMSPYHGEPG